MQNFNKVILVGNLTKDPELKQVPSGISVADMRLAVSEKYKNKSGELVESACFLDVEAWGRQAEICGEYLTKGSPILLEGSLKLDTWENDKGERRSKLKVRAARIRFMGGNGKAGSETSEVTDRNHVGSEQDQDENLPF